MNKILLIAMMTIAGLAQAEPAQVVRGSIAEQKYRACFFAEKFAEYAYSVQRTGGEFTDYLSTVDEQGIAGPPTTATSNLAMAVGRYLFLEHGPGNVFHTCMKDPSKFRLNF